MKYCIYCGAETPEGIKYCLQCGKPIVLEANSKANLEHEIRNESKKSAMIENGDNEERLDSFQKKKNGNYDGEDSLSVSDKDILFAYPESNAKNENDSVMINSNKENDVISSSTFGLEEATVKDEDGIIIQSQSKNSDSDGKDNSYKESKDTNDAVSVIETKEKRKDSIVIRKKYIIIAIALVVVIAGYFILANQGVVPNIVKTNYEGKYTGIKIDEDSGEEKAYKVIVKEGKMSITAGTSIEGKYKYDDDGDYIYIEQPLSEEGDSKAAFTLSKTGGKYYLTLYAGALAETTIEVAPGDDPAVNGSKNKASENEDDRDNLRKEGNKLSKNYYVVGEDIDPGIYDFGPAKGEKHFSVKVYDSMKYFKQSPDYDIGGDSDDYIDHYENYYGDTVEEGISLKKGNVLYVDYQGVVYKKQ